MNHYPHHLGDYAKDTLGLSMLEHGAYRLLLDAYYAHEAPLDAEEVYAIAKAGTPAERKAVDRVLKKFRLDGGRYYHKRVEEEIAAYRERSKAAAEKANKRWRKDAGDDAGGMPRHMPQDSHGNAGAMLASSHKPVINPLSEKQHHGGRDIPAPPDRLAALLSLCGLHRVESSGVKAQLHLRQMAVEGVTDEQFLMAYRVARQNIPEPGTIRVQYLAPIVADVLAGKVAKLNEPRGRDAIPGALARIAAIEAKHAAE